MKISYSPTLGGVNTFSAEVLRLQQQADSTGIFEIRLIEEFRAKNNLSMQPQSVLDLGGGTGAFSSLLATVWDHTTVTCADPSSEFLERATVATLQLGRDPIPKNKYDCVIIRHVFQHLKDAEQDELLAQAFDALAEKGTLFIIDVDDSDWGTVTPIIPGLDSLFARLAREQERRGGNRRVLTHLHEKLRNAGFSEPTRLRSTVSSNVVGLDSLDVHIHPRRWTRHVADASLNLNDLARITFAYMQWRNHAHRQIALNIHALATVRL